MGSIPAPGTHLAALGFVPGARLRHAVFGASRLNLAGSIPAPGTPFARAQFVPRTTLRRAAPGIKIDVLFRLVRRNA